MHVERELWANELGRVALAAIEGIHGAGVFDPMVESKAIMLLQGIQGILDDESLNDFNCVEEIVSLLEASGISTSRHDFG